MATDPAEIPIHHIAGKLPAVPGWRVLAFDHDPDGKRIEVAPGACAVAEHPVEAWGLLVSISQLSGLFSMFAGGGDPPPCPLGAAGARLDKLKDFICLSPPGETTADAIARIEAPIRKAAAERASKR